MESRKIRTLVECAMMLALASILAVIPVIKLPYGGSVTFASMVPIVLISFRHGTKWGALTSAAFAVFQIMSGFYPPPTRTFGYFVLVVLLDYVIAFGVLGFAKLGTKVFKNKTLGVAFGSFTVTLLRYACHFGSGMLIWHVYAKEGQPIWAYSLAYNGSYMIPEIILTTIVATLLYKVVESIGSKKTAS